MTDTYFHHVFYDESDLSSFSVREDCSAIENLPAAIVVPHARFSMVKPLFEEAFGYVRKTKPSLIVIMQCLHNRLLRADEGISCITTEKKKITGENFSIPISDLSETIAERRNTYFEEEPGCEELYPIIACLYPETPVLPLLASKSSTSLESVVNRILDREKNTLFIVSSNARKPFDLNTSCSGMWISALKGSWEIGSVKEDSVVHFCAYRRNSDV